MTQLRKRKGNWYQHCLISMRAFEVWHDLFVLHIAIYSSITFAILQTQIISFITCLFTMTYLTVQTKFHQLFEIQLRS